MSPLAVDKPPYRVPSMDEIEALPWNGYSVISTFSGAGGSCLGYRMAGYKVLWANEFVPAAQETYKANHPNSILDTRDIREIRPEEILEATGLGIGELDVFDGSPPCQAFSTVGKREKGWGDLKKYEHGATQKNEELFFEYIRLLDGLKPKTFIAENVSGIVKGTAKGYFKNILRDLRGCGYNVKAKLLDAQWLGVPQTRQRVIFQGVRNNLRLEPRYPVPLSYQYTVKEAIPSLVSAIHDTSGLYSQGSFIDKPCPAITIGVNSLNSTHFKISTKPSIRMMDTNGGFGTNECSNTVSPTITATQCRMSVESNDSKRRMTIDELKRICAFPDDFILIGTYAQQWERLGNSVPPVMMMHIAKAVQVGVLDKI